MNSGKVSIPPDTWDADLHNGRIVGTGKQGGADYVLVRFPRILYPVKYNAANGERLDVGHK